MRDIDLADVQGGVLRAYGRQGFPKARYFFLTIRDAAKARGFVDALRPRITTASHWSDPKRGELLLRTRRPRLNDAIRATTGVSDYPGAIPRDLEKPKVALNIAFTFYGLLALDVPTRTLRGMPDEFIDGMEKRAALLGDDHYLDARDPIWRDSKGDKRVHVLISMNAEMNDDGTPVAELEAETETLRRACANADSGVALLSGHGRDDADHQDMSAVLRDDGGVMKPTNKEHFGLSDGFGDPVFDGQLTGPAERVKVIGGGKILADQSWAPLATGEFLLGYPDEAQEVPGAAMPIEFSRNGTFMAYRKLHENVASYAAYLDEQGRRYAAHHGLADRQEARETVEAKMVGRWSDGIPLSVAPTYADRAAFNARLAAARAAGDKAELAKIALQYVNFRYRDDRDGTKCPVTAHLRRVNTRDTLDPNGASTDPKKWEGSVLNNRRRILRRGLPYGQVDAAAPSDTGEHGIVFLAICSSLFRQFEFVQQQWIQYGLDFDAGGDTCPILGNHDADAKFVIPAASDAAAAPFLCEQVPQLVEPRGGDYFFIPSMTALRMIGMGIVDPT